jgi:NAD(P)-dependent dehydrogenase (short-subunit alcohol dehydrogenase family)
MDENAAGCAVITGGAGGIGVAAARRLAARGMQIVLWDKSPAAPEVARGLGALALAIDVTDPAAVAGATDQTTQQAGAIRVLVNAAGITGPNAPVDEYAVEDWRRVLAINLDGTFLCCKHVVPMMKRAGYGRIVNVSSIAGKEGNPNAAAYSASKAGVIALTKSLGKELVGFDIRVNCVTPAMIETDLLQQMTQEFIEYAKSKIPLGRLGRVEEVASMIDWLASPECSFSTGAVFDISGGRATY